MSRRNRPPTLPPDMFAGKLTRNGTDGRVYGGDCNLIHIEDGKRGEMGAKLAQYLDVSMRHDAWARRARNRHEVENQRLCPGCYMIAGFNAMVELARDNGQPLSELGRTMAAAFAKLADCETDECIEEIAVMLDEAGDGHNDLV